MKEQEYYAEIEHLIKKNEIGKRARKLEENQTLLLILLDKMILFHCIMNCSN